MNSRIIVSNTTLAWVAGIIDSSGKIVRKKNPQRSERTKQIVLYVETKELAIIKRLSDITGIRPTTREATTTFGWSRKGCVIHCPDKHIHIDNAPIMPTIGRWTITGASAAIILWNIIGLLITDRGMSDVLHELLIQVPVSGQGRAAIDRAIDRMERLGWDIPPYILPEGHPKHKRFDLFEGAENPEALEEP